jgi:hypothetical protein
MIRIKDFFYLRSFQGLIIMINGSEITSKISQKVIEKWLIIQKITF